MEHAPEAPHVRGERGSLRRGARGRGAHLRRGVPRRADAPPSFGRRRGTLRLGGFRRQAEVRQLERFVDEEEVGGFDVSVRDAEAVRVRERAREGSERRPRLRLVHQGAVASASVERGSRVAAVGELEDDGEVALAAETLEGGDDARVRAQPGENARLARDAAHRGRAGSAARGAFRGRGARGGPVALGGRRADLARGSSTGPRDEQRHRLHRDPEAVAHARALPHDRESALPDDAADAIALVERGHGLGGAGRGRGREGRGRGRMRFRFLGRGDRIRRQGRARGRPESRARRLLAPVALARGRGLGRDAARHRAEPRDRGEWRGVGDVGGFGRDRAGPRRRSVDRRPFSPRGPDCPRASASATRRAASEDQNLRFLRRGLRSTTTRAAGALPARRWARRARARCLPRPRPRSVTRARRAHAYRPRPRPVRSRRSGVRRRRRDARFSGGHLDAFASPARSRARERVPRGRVPAVAGSAASPPRSRRPTATPGPSPPTSGHPPPLSRTRPPPPPPPRPPPRMRLCRRRSRCFRSSSG